MLINLTTYRRIRDALTKEPLATLTLDLFELDPFDIYSVGAAFVDHSISKSDVLKRWAVARGIPLSTFDLYASPADMTAVHAHTSEQPVEPRKPGLWRIVKGEPDTPDARYWHSFAGWGGLAGSSGFDDVSKAVEVLPPDGAWWFDEDESEDDLTPVSDLERMAAELQALRKQGVLGSLCDDVVIGGVSYVVRIDTEEPAPCGPLHQCEHVWVVEGGYIAQYQIDDGMFPQTALGQPEWQLSDGPAGERSYSESYASLAEAYAAALALPNARLITVERLLGGES